MCGIAGEIGFDRPATDTAALARMTEAMAPRGPDAAGLFAQANVALGHRRLQIIDLSERSQQPMLDPELGLAIVFNGCIYNYRELRRELEGLGYRFFSEGDTETILKAYHAWGADCVDRLSGMFAFAIWERDTRVVILARDRLGIKPLYYAGDGRRLRFASSLPALLAGGGIDTRIDPVALNFYMNFHAVVPPPHTILRGVRKLPAATVMRIAPDGSRNERRYWRVRHGCDPAEASLSAEAWQERILHALRIAVRRRLVADVPVGVLLSGGLDSSLLVALMRDEGHDALETFSVGFESVGNERGDEFEYSDIVAERFATRHHKIRIDSAKRMLPALPGCIAAMSEPMVSHDNIGFYLLSEEVSKHVKVVQSGQGADEVFGGYHWYPPMLASEDAVRDYCRLFRDRDHAEYVSAVASELCAQDWAEGFVADHFAEPGADTPADKALRLDATIMLADDPVKRVDNMTMAWGLEARVPFLDHELVELAAAAPAALKVGNGGKYLLKEAARRILPAEVIDRPKGYFPVPALKHIRGEVLDMVRSVLTSRRAAERGVFNPDYVERLLREPESHYTPLGGSKLWQVALLEMWLQTHDL